MNASTFAGKVSKPSGYTDCGENIYEEKDPSKIVTLPQTNAATDGMYSGKKYYDFTNGEPKSGSKATEIAASN
jgi:hypothetical protein